MAGVIIRSYTKLSKTVSTTHSSLLLTLLALLWLVLISACMDSPCSIRVTTAQRSFVQPYIQTLIEKRYTNEIPAQGVDTLTVR